MKISKTKTIAAIALVLSLTAFTIATEYRFVKNNVTGKDLAKLLGRNAKPDSTEKQKETSANKNECLYNGCGNFY